MMLYFAYGMNTNRLGMTNRCPEARPMGPATLLGHRFRFAGPADVQVDRRHDVQGVLWEITDKCLASLDQLEGYPAFYNRKWAQVRHNTEVVNAMVYYMQPGHRNGLPGQGYWHCVLEGYRDFGLSTTQLNSALPKNHNYSRYTFG